MLSGTGNGSGRRGGDSNDFPTTVVGALRRRSGMLVVGLTPLCTYDGSLYLVIVRLDSSTYYLPQYDVQLTITRPAWRARAWVFFCGSILPGMRVRASTLGRSGTYDVGSPLFNDVYLSEFHLSRGLPTGHLVLVCFYEMFSSQRRYQFAPLSFLDRPSLRPGSSCRYGPPYLPVPRPTHRSSTPGFRPPLATLALHGGSTGV